jgi:hypothetical protein
MQTIDKYQLNLNTNVSNEYLDETKVLISKYLMRNFKNDIRRYGDPQYNMVVIDDYANEAKMAHTLDLDIKFIGEVDGFVVFDATHNYHGNIGIIPQYGFRSMAKPQFDKPIFFSKTIRYARIIDTPLTMEWSIVRLSDASVVILDEDIKYLVEEVSTRFRDPIALECQKNMVLQTQLQSSGVSILDSGFPVLDWSGINNRVEKPLEVGDKVATWAFGADRIGIITKIGRKYAHIAYVTKSDPWWVKTTKRPIK